MLLIPIRQYWLPLSALILGLITTLSLWPIDELPAVPGGDKLHHYIAYAALMFPAALRRPRHWLWVALFFLTWSGAIELIQPYVNRYGEWLDLAANAGGLASGLLLAMVVNHLSGETAINRTR
ncbi:MAG: hypothetical protein Q9M30_00310 [Mariprofundaceae bacterium]|nr:hypothetical protein [Mariprofundaceae bacterium]